MTGSTRAVRRGAACPVPEHGRPSCLRRSPWLTALVGLWVAWGPWTTAASSLVCDDGIDNDGDGLADFPNDPGCSWFSDVFENPECNDGNDNEGDGKIDFDGGAGASQAAALCTGPGMPFDCCTGSTAGCAGAPDPACTSGSGTSEGAPPVACNDEVDNDGDGLVDFPGDAGCAGPTALLEDPGCNDGDDGDGDGLVDFDGGSAAAQGGALCTGAGTPVDCCVAASTGCTGPPDPGCNDGSDPSELSALACDDGTDNDGDGLTDLADPGCDDGSDPSERTDLACDDGVDNDGDALVDYPADPGCAGIDDLLENPACNDGMDNDGDGFHDFDGGITATQDATLCTALDTPFDCCAGPGTGCHAFPDPGCSAGPEDSEDDPPGPCRDAIDNDGDGLVDFPADPGCAALDDGPELTQCNDGDDNDADGSIDFDGGAAATQGGALCTAPGVPFDCCSGSAAGCTGAGDADCVSGSVELEAVCGDAVVDVGEDCDGGVCCKETCEWRGPPCCVLDVCQIDLVCGITCFGDDLTCQIVAGPQGPQCACQ